MRRMRLAYDVHLVTEERGGAIYKTRYLATMLHHIGHTHEDRLKAAQLHFPGQDITLTSSHHELTEGTYYGELEFIVLPKETKP